MNITIRKWLTFTERKLEEAGQAHAQPLRKTAVVAVVKNPFLPGYRADLSEGVAASAAIGKAIADQLLATLNGDVIQSYGKGGLVGVAGEQEHANALLTVTFAEPIRQVIGGKAWIPSVTKVGHCGSVIDVPLAHKDALYVRSHYDAMSLCMPEAPLPDEIALIFAVANRGRLNARVGGLNADEVQGLDGLV